MYGEEKTIDRKSKEKMYDQHTGLFGYPGVESGNEGDDGDAIGTKYIHEQELQSFNVGDTSEILYETVRVYDTTGVTNIELPFDTFVHTHVTSSIGFLSQEITVAPDETIYFGMAAGLDPKAEGELERDLIIRIFDLAENPFTIPNYNDGDLDVVAEGDSDNGGPGYRWSDNGEWENDTGEPVVIQALYTCYGSDYGDILPIGQELHLHFSKTDDGTGTIPELDIEFPAEFFRDEPSTGYSYAIGDGVKAVYSDQFNVGKYNDYSNLDLIFSVGGGTSDTDRKNILEIDRVSGNVSLPMMDLSKLNSNSLVPKKLIDDIHRFLENNLIDSSIRVIDALDTSDETAIVSNSTLFAISDEVGGIELYDKNVIKIGVIDRPTDVDSDELGRYKVMNEDYIAFDNCKEGIHGKVYVYDFTNLEDPLYELEPNNPQSNTQFGRGLALMGNLLCAPIYYGLGFQVFNLETGSYVKTCIAPDSDWGIEDKIVGNGSILLALTDSHLVELWDQDLNFVKLIECPFDGGSYDLVSLGQKHFYLTVDDPNNIDYLGNNFPVILSFDLDGNYVRTFKTKKPKNGQPSIRGFGGLIAEAENGNLYVGSGPERELEEIYEFSPDGIIIDVVKLPPEISSDIEPFMCVFQDLLLVLTGQPTVIVYSRDLTLKDDLVTVNTSTFPTPLQTYFGIYDNKLDSVLGWMSNYLFYEQVFTDTGKSEYEVDLIRYDTHTFTLTETSLIKTPTNQQIGRKGTITIRQDTNGTWDCNFDTGYIFPEDGPLINKLPNAYNVFEYKVIDIDKVLVIFLADFV